MNKQEILKLIHKYNTGNCTEDEIYLLETWYLRQDKLYHKELDIDKIEHDLDLVYKDLPKPKVKVVWWTRVAAAAVVILGLCVGLYNYYFKYSGSDVEQTSVYSNDVSPGGNKAVLTLDNGQTIYLDSTKHGVIVNTNLTYDDGSAVKLSTNNSENSKLLTMQTPRGGQYQLVLPDGTKVWLNAGSSLKFPSTFTRLKERRVELNGEAYFEVAKVFLDKGIKHKKQRMPFIVKTTLQEVEVLGTHINVSAYSDEPITATTLIEGIVKVSSRNAFAEKKGSRPVILKPAEQAGTDNQGYLVVKTVNTEQVLAWKNDYFMFKDEPIQSIMRKISRWYDIDVSYEGDLSDITFLGAVSKSKNISTVLKIMESTGTVHFKIEGRRVIVKR